jgi:hypothetical protein
VLNSAYFYSYFLKNIAASSPSNIMFNKRTTVALFAIAIASSLIVVSGGFVGSAYAAKKVKQHEHGSNPAVPFSGLPAVLDKDKSSSPKSHSANAGDSGWTIGDANGISADERNVWKEECNS